MEISDILKSLGLASRVSGTYGVQEYESSGKTLSSYSPIDGGLIGEVFTTDEAAYERVIADCEETFHRWRRVPAPQRGEIVRQMGMALREHKDALGALITVEMGKILSEGKGEVQEAIDIADFAVGLSRQLYGLTMHSERPAHRMYEQWHPLGTVGVISAFNFPMAVWAWNAMIAAVCGDVVLWKPSEVTPVSAVAINSICQRVAAAHGFPALFSLVVGDGPELGKKMAADHRIPLISATGSCRMGYSVAETVGRRLGRSILELGGNNAIIVLDDADMSLVLPSVLFGAVGTAGQRCTSTRRLLVTPGIYDVVKEKLTAAYSQVRIGNPLHESTLMGPLVHQPAVEQYQAAVRVVPEQGGKVLAGGDLVAGMSSPLYVQPTLVEISHDAPIVRQETFAPILYLIKVADLDEALRLHNDVPQGLSSAIFTKSVQSAERFLSPAGSDCGIANVNIGTSGAEIGGAFGGEKETGGGRESGSDSWKQYMRRQTCTINYSSELPLAQGVKFEL
ncbi:MAG: aldehyde dehydrogenase family protein [Bdellovibrionales bacterium]|nr:aldehyde dehydrogenase family protein [Bdellovibrionales bacterium]